MLNMYPVLWILTAWYLRTTKVSRNNPRVKRLVFTIIIIIILLLYLKRVTHLAYNNYSSMWPSKDSFTIVHVDRYIQAMQ